MTDDSKITITLDGDQWCALVGENLAVGEAGFGDDPLLAVADLRSKLTSKTIEVSPKSLQWLSAAVDPSQVSDGYHTFGELYRHRHLLFALAAKLGNWWGNGDRKLKGWKSWQHSDDTPMYDGYFVAGLELPTGQISYHLPAEMWTLVQLPHYDRALEWDGHTAEQVLERIEAYLR